MQQAPESADPKRRAKFVIGGGVILLSLVALVAWAMTRPNSTSFFYTPTEVVELPVAQGAEEYRVNGKVVPDTVEEDGLTTSFDISDGTTSVRLTTEQPPTPHRRATGSARSLPSPRASLRPTMPSRSPVCSWTRSSACSGRSSAPSR